MENQKVSLAGGYRNGAGRKPAKVQKTAVTVYLTPEEKDAILSIPLPKQTSISQKCNHLMNVGFAHIQTQNKTDPKTVRYIDLFAGLGGVRIGFTQALESLGLKGKCLFSSEIKPSAIRAYKEYFGEDSTCDITKIDPVNLPDFDFLLGGFPCQAFSQAGKGLGFEDTRGTLFFNIANILSIKKPAGFVLENVEGLVGHNGGKTFNTIKDTLKNLGYKISFAVLNGKDFGLAQSRNRIYIVGLKNKQPNDLTGFDITTTHLKSIIDESVPPVKTPFTKCLLSHYNVNHLHGKAIKDKRGGTNNIHSWDIGIKGEVNQSQKDLLSILLRQRRNKKWADVIGIDWMDGMPLTLEIIKTFYQHKNLRKLLDDLVSKGYLAFEHPKKLENGVRVYDDTLPKGYNIVTGKLSFEFTKILNPEDVTPTLVATDALKLAVPVNDGVRPLTVSEGLALFGFPSDYKLDFLKTSEAFDLLGNTVCVPVIKAISERLLATHQSV